MPQPDTTHVASIGRTVFAGDGAALGRLSALYIDTDTRLINFGALTLTHWGRRHTVFVPLDAADLAANSLTLRCGGHLVRHSPKVQVGRGLPAESEAALYAYYDMPYETPIDATRRMLPAP
ncbi:PRC-barrel domain-containing protein [uncultured Jatrophihabitans sp.]|uniref:PRC-barrel domain-containing protein n=1 Tax=uncultured Jatrophihabitans sp. TaxID=1610747 RepID=UPI0035C9FB43